MEGATMRNPRNASTWVADHKHTVLKKDYCLLGFGMQNAQKEGFIWFVFKTACRQANPALFIYALL